MRCVRKLIITGIISSAAALAGSLSHAASTITYTTDSVTELSGSFDFDIADGGLGSGTTIAIFPHFHISLSPPEVYPTGSTYFEVEIGVSDTIDLRGVDISFPTLSSALQQYDTSSGLLASYPDVSGSFTSPFDGVTTIYYSYTNVGESALDIFSGDFTFSTIPEPSTAGLACIGLGLVVLRRRRR